jgi:uncharacterized small protein (DUF1192 family)
MTVAELEQRLSSDELTEWFAYFRIDAERLKAARKE